MPLLLREKKKNTGGFPLERGPQPRSNIDITGVTRQDSIMRACGELCEISMGVASDGALGLNGEVPRRFMDDLTPHVRSAGRHGVSSVEHY